MFKRIAEWFKKAFKIVKKVVGTEKPKEKLVCANRRMRMAVRKETGLLLPSHIKKSEWLFWRSIMKNK